MANKPTDAQIAFIKEALELDKACNYARLEYYLRQIIAGHDVTFETRSDQLFTLSAKEAWDVIFPWAQSEGNLPVGDRQKISIKNGATHLLNYIKINVRDKVVEAAASYHNMLEEASTPITPTFPSQNSNDYNYQKVNELRRTQIKILQSGLIGKIYSNLEKAKILEGLDPKDRVYVLQMFAAGHQNFRNNLANERVDRKRDPLKDFTPEKIHELLLHTPGVHDVGSLARHFYSNASQDEIDTIIKTIEATISSVYHDDEAKYQQDMASYYSVASLSPSLSNIEYLVGNIDIHATPAEKQRLAQSLRSQIIRSTTGAHQSGEELLRAALSTAGLKPKSIAAFETLFPYLEEIEIKERHLLLGSDLTDRDPRLLSVRGLAETLGVSPRTPWETETELNKITQKLTGGVSPQAAFDREFAKGDGANLVLLGELTDLMGRHADYVKYHGALASNPFYQLRETWAKGTGNFYAGKASLDRFTTKLWAGYEKIDDAINWPARTLVNWQEKLIERFPLLDPIGFFTKKWTSYQTDIALRIHKWALSIPAESSAWLKSFAGHIGDFTEGFIKHDADWSAASSFFVSRKWGNALDWGTRFATKGKFETFSKLKVSIAETAWGAFSKMSPELAAKMAASELGKAIFGFLAGELTLGASIAIQVGWEAVKSVFGRVFNFAKNILAGKGDGIGSVVSMALMSTFLAANALLGGIPAAVIIAFDLLVKAFKLIGTLLLTLLSLAALISAIVVAFFVIVWTGLITPTFQLDSGVSDLVANILCDDSGNPTISGVETGSTSVTTGGKPTLAKAVCLAKYLNACYGPSVNASNVSTGLSCLATFAIAPAAIEEIKSSASGYVNLQCVGFVKAVVAWAGTSISSHNACGYVADPRFVSGLGGAKPGDAIVFNSSGTCSDKAPGHIGILQKPVEETGAMICLVDANQVCDGCVSEKNCLPKTGVAGYLKL